MESRCGFHLLTFWPGLPVGAYGIWRASFCMRAFLAPFSAACLATDSFVLPLLFYFRMMSIRLRASYYSSKVQVARGCFLTVPQVAA